MRTFNKIEKEIIGRILDNQIFLANFIDPYLKGLRIEVRNPNQKRTPLVKFLFEMQGEVPTDNESKYIINRLGEISNLVITVTKLIQYLENNELITVYQGGGFDRIIRFGQGVVNLKSIKYSFPDKTISDIFVRYSMLNIAPVSELEEFIRNGYKTKDDIRKENETLFFKDQKLTLDRQRDIDKNNIENTNRNIKIAAKQASTSRLQLYVSIALATFALVSLFYNIFSSNKLDETQFNNLLEKYDNVTSVIDTLGNTINKDTINAHVFSVEDSINIHINDSLP